MAPSLNEPGEFTVRFAGRCLASVRGWPGACRGSSTAGRLSRLRAGARATRITPATSATIPAAWSASMPGER